MIPWLLAAAMLFSSCGGGGESSSSSSSAAPASTGEYLLSWDVPNATIDNTAIDPYEEIDHYEIYVSEDPSFNKKDVPAALVSAVEETPTGDGTIMRTLVKEFNLGLLGNLPSANLLYVSLRAVGVDRQKSDFMYTVAWTRS